MLKNKFPVLQKIKMINWALVAAIFGGLYALFLPFVGSQGVDNSEAYTYTNVPIELILYGKFHYPLVSNVFLFPEINSFMVAPPLFFLLSGFVLKIVGIGVWQAMLVSFLTALLIAAAAAAVAAKYYGTETAILSIILFSGWGYIQYMWGNGRPDHLLGLFFAVLLMIIFNSWTNARTGTPLKRDSFFAGLTIGLMMLSHWQGIFGFLFLPIHFAMVWKKKNPWLTHVFLSILGYLAVFIPWGVFYAHYGDNIFYIFYLAMLNGAKRFTTFVPDVVVPATEIFKPFYQMGGGSVVLVGGVLFAAYYFVYLLPFAGLFFERARAGEAHNTLHLDAFLFFSALVWFAFYFAFIGNRHYQYLGNVLFPIILISSRGYLLVLGVVRTLLKTARFAYVLVLTGLVVGGWAYYEKNLNLPDLSSLLPPNQLQSAARRVFDRFVSNDDHIGLGSAAYLYLYDQKGYTSTYKMESIAAARLPEMSGIKISWNNPALTFEERGELLIEAGEVAVIPDILGMYQAKYIDERVWRSNFKKVAVVFVPGMEEPFPILYRNDVATEYFFERGLKTGSSGCDQGVYWIVYDLGRTFDAEIDDDDWDSYPESEKLRLIRGYFEFYNWFGQTPVTDPETLQTWVVAMDYYYYFQNSYQEFHLKGNERSFTQAMEYMINAEAIKLWCKPK